ncbi:adenylyltransferase/cytidyltransferase family protein [Moorena sp. SIO3H5]|uniref:adenylyltransferase/cytidyltransferase family protein n=1 Tax=Moorena sp. SIO3H5 TaxID=2607834 RepID=UPI0013BCA664|nr:adenylyltransferase/cytidyltransferase family protein [Moorena sp. SIO3H5]NEO72984.1 adenylyltransferase/cytidyltransferase family protein [Moorena sp. SIO3H5]
MTGIYTADELQQLMTQESERWRPLVFTNGCFDILHIGHVRYLKIAKSLGSALVVGLNSDQSVNRIKQSQPGYPSRPLVPEIQRAEILATLKPVDGVVIFAETTANRLIEALQPEVYVKGGDYTLSTLPEAPIVQSYGGRIELVQVEFPTSTTQIINRILQAR